MPRAERLRRVFQHRDAMFFSERHDRRHVRALAEKVDGDDRLRLARARQRFLERGDGDVESVRIDVHENGPRTEPRDAARGREKSVRRRDDRVARSDAERHEEHELRVRPRRNADRVRRARVRRDRVFKCLRFRPEHERLRIGDLLHRSEDLRFQRSVLELEVEQRHLHGRRLGTRAPRRRARIFCSA